MNAPHFPITARLTQRGQSSTMVMPDGSPRDNDRVEIGPTQLAFDEWAAAGLIAPNLTAMRQYRLDRIVGQLQKHDYGAALLFDPLNIAMPLITNMQLWNTHNPFRACLVTATGYMILWDYKTHRSADHNPLVRDTIWRVNVLFRDW